MFLTNQKTEIRHAIGNNGWQCILGKKRAATGVTAETWFPNRALIWEPQPDVWRVLALELVAASDTHRKSPTAKKKMKSIDVI